LAIYLNKPVKEARLVPNAKKPHLVSMADFLAEVLACHALAASDERPGGPHDVLFGYDRLGWHAFLAMLQFAVLPFPVRRLLPGVLGMLMR